MGRTNVIPAPVSWDSTSRRNRCYRKTTAERTSRDPAKSTATDLSPSLSLQATRQRCCTEAPSRRLSKITMSAYTFTVRATRIRWTRQKWEKNYGNQESERWRGMYSLSTRLLPTTICRSESAAELLPSSNRIRLSSCLTTLRRLPSTDYRHTSVSESEWVTDLSRAGQCGIDQWKLLGRLSAAAWLKFQPTNRDLPVRLSASAAVAAVSQSPHSPFSELQMEAGRHPTGRAIRRRAMRTNADFTDIEFLESMPSVSDLTV